MKIVKLLLNPRTMSTIISAVSALICAALAGCRLALGDASISDLRVEIGYTTNTMFHVEH